MDHFIKDLTEIFIPHRLISVGFEGDGFVCTDINECVVNNGGCSTNPRVQCINTRVSKN